MLKPKSPSQEKIPRFHELKNQRLVIWDQVDFFPSSHFHYNCRPGTDDSLTARLGSYLRRTINLLPTAAEASFNISVSNHRIINHRTVKIPELRELSVEGSRSWLLLLTGEGDMSNDVKYLKVDCRFKSKKECCFWLTASGVAGPGFQRLVASAMRERGGGRGEIETAASYV